MKITKKRVGIVLGVLVLISFLNGSSGAKGASSQVQGVPTSVQTFTKPTDGATEAISTAPTSVPTSTPKPTITIQPTSTIKTYTNVDGDKVQSPTFSETIPSGATAKCRDGSYSFSQHRSGTCSHHGGVAVWY